MSSVAAEFGIGSIASFSRVMRSRNVKARLFLNMRERVLAPVHERRVTTVLIVCGDCSAWREDPEAERNPRKLFLTHDGRCEGCGGRSYELASVMFHPYSRKELV